MTPMSLFLNSAPSQTTTALVSPVRAVSGVNSSIGEGVVSGGSGFISSQLTSSAFTAVPLPKVSGRAGLALFFTLRTCAFALFAGALRAGAFALFFGP